MRTQRGRILIIAFVMVALGAAVEQAEAASFVSVSPMNNARNFHTATLLPNGKVLVAGGFGAATSAESYDPATDTWTVRGSLHVARAGSTATLLPNGNVLVAGGGQKFGSFISSTSCELYFPARGIWTLTAPMKHARVLHTATLLPNGKVLVVGGTAGGNSELYDPATWTWTETGSASISPRAATLLPNGKVLGVGGGAELYDPATGMWTPTGAPSTNYITATLLLNGKVLAAGGNRTFTAELYDPDSGTWSTTGSLTWDRDYCTATLLRNGQVLVAGGYQQETDTPMASGELYDPATGTWTETPMNEPHFSHTATLLSNGKVLIAGGNGWNVNLLSSAELYEPDSDGTLSPPTILHQTDQVLSFSWTGVGTLEQSDSLTPPNWQLAPSQDDPHTISTTEPMKFFRVKAN